MYWTHMVLLFNKEQNFDFDIASSPPPTRTLSLKMINALLTSPLIHNHVLSQDIQCDIPLLMFDSCKQELLEGKEGKDTSLTLS